ncbi:hypothetical protein GCM10010954_14470 [Halobacillus andaensis]|uniref:Homeodomain phBC6A51-type domain-containing protein n=1 Tax=Halobacillus andaensis TaxID=1176239 RepID=A0A917B350_HALAA|nr:phBC6A51 family helix-turn-helix protein [Halobacillus andaensis]MBP2004251.1 hypothetical protein [Halobacillus andaensis]GGF16931.1 hypothetical protein GCM10010954_14470 [Halobacillus andaensis]
MADKKEISIPYGISKEQAEKAKRFVIARHQEGISITDFCKREGISTKTFYQWKDDKVFSSYLTALGETIVTDDESEAWQQVKKKIMKLATSEKAGAKEISLFMESFEYVVEAEKQARMKELGIVPEHEKRGSEKSLEDKKAVLIQRLTPQGKEDKDAE